MSTRQRRVRAKVGDVVRIALGDDRFAFGWVLSNPLMAFFDYSTADASPPTSYVVEQPVAFRICVMNYALTRGVWPVVGHSDPPAPVLESPLFFKQDAMSGALSTTRDGDEEFPASREECARLERAAVWDPEHVVDRLNDHFAGRPNVWLESLRLK